MAIPGIESVVYGVDDIELCTRYFIDFGLSLTETTPDLRVFRLPEGSSVVLRTVNDPKLPGAVISGTGVRETIWGVDSQRSLDTLAEDLSRDRGVYIDEGGTAHFLTDCGLAMGLRVYHRKDVTYAPDPINAPGRVNRVNQTRKWHKRAYPKTLNHVVFGVLDYWETAAFFKDRLGFRLSDHQKGVGVYMRADGAHEHHNIFFLNCNAPGIGGKPCFHHVNFGVEDIDELMVGYNYMMRRGWQQGFLGNGRHRISSSLFCYLASPAGGEIEYGTDGDYLDDNWVPREWEFRFGVASWMQSPPAFMQDEPEWDVQFYKELPPSAADERKPPKR